MEGARRSHRRTHDLLDPGRPGDLRRGRRRAVRLRLHRRRGRVPARHRLRAELHERVAPRRPLRTGSAVQRRRADAHPELRPVGRHGGDPRRPWWSGGDPARRVSRDRADSRRSRQRRSRRQGLRHLELGRRRLGDRALGRHDPVDPALVDRRALRFRVDHHHRHRRSRGHGCHGQHVRRVRPDAGAAHHDRDRPDSSPTTRSPRSSCSTARTGSTRPETRAPPAASASSPA